MNAYTAYQQAQNLPMTRVDLILALYRKALDLLGRARQALAEQGPDAARSLLVKSQLIVLGMASELPAYKDETALNFLRLYEFAAHQMAQGAAENIDAAAQVLRTLMDGFEAVRAQAVSLEMEGQIPPLDAAHLVSLTA